MKKVALCLSLSCWSFPLFAQFIPFAFFKNRPSTGALVAWYRFDESSYNGTANEVLDSSGNGVHGTASGDATTSSDAKFGRALTVEDTRKWGHTHLDEIIERASEFQNQQISLIHLSARYSTSEAERILEKKLPRISKK